MAQITYRIDQFNAETCSKDVWDLFFSHWVEYFKEAYPNYRVPERDLQIKRMAAKDPFTDHHRWLIFDEEKCIGYWYLGYTTEESPTYATNKHIAEFFLSISKEFRRKGIGSELIKKSLDHAKERNAEIIQCWAGTKAGKISCEQWGFAMQHEHIGNKLIIADVDWDLMRNWIDEGKKKAKEVVVERFNDVPEKDINEYVKLYTETMNQAPWNAEGEDNETPESRRHKELEFTKKGYEWTTLVSREKDGIISGMTEIFYNPLEAEVIEQELTGVMEPYRGRNLGKWLKAEMLFFIRDQYPEIEYIATGNAENNAPMLSINNKMGFKRVSAWYIMELKI